MSRRRPRGAYEWTLRIVLSLLIVAAAIVIGGLVRGDFGPWKTSAAAAPSRGQLQATIQSEMPKHVSGVVRVVCVMPGSWASGQTFTCYGYGSSQKELAQVNGTVLPDNGNQAQWNEVWSGL